MKKNSIPYERQIFVCTNQKADNQSCCGGHDGEEIFRKLRAIAKERGLHPRIRVAQAKCLGKCEIGANIMVFPEGQWYSHVTIDDVNTIAEQYLKE